LKPTEGRVPLTGLIPGLTTPRSVRVMSSIGPLARSVDDLGLLFSIIAGPDGRDTGVPPVPIGEAPRVRLKHLRIAVAPTLPPLPVATDIRIAMESLAGELGQHGATLEEILPAVDVERDLSRAGAIIGMMIGAFQPGQPHSTAQYFEALDHRDRSIQAWEDFFEQWDVLICPPSMTAAFPHCDPGTPLPVNGQEVDYWAVSAHCTLFNYTGHPAVVLPWRLDPAGLPIGIQLVTKRWDESRLLALAAAVAEVSGQFRRPAGY
jgi:amidase